MGDQGGLAFLLAAILGFSLEPFARALGVDAPVLSGALIGSAVAFLRGNGPANQSWRRTLINAIGGFWIALYSTAGVILLGCEFLHLPKDGSFDRLVAIGMGTAGIYISDFFTNFSRGLSNNGGRFADILTHSAGMALRAMIDRLRPSTGNQVSPEAVDAPDDTDSQIQDGGDNACSH
jgi:hypothetical protein